MVEPSAFNDAVTSVTEQFLTVLSAPVPFLLVVGTVAFAIWKFLTHYYEGRISAKDDLLALRQAQIDDYKNKLDGATPDAAKARIDALEERIEQLGPRRLSADQRQVMAAILDPFKGSAVQIVTDGASADAAQLSHGLSATFRSAGWITSGGMVIGLGNPPLSGIALIVPDPLALSPEQRAIEGALRAANLEFDLQRGGQPPPSPNDNEPEPIAEILLTNRLQD